MSVNFERMHPTEEANARESMWSSVMGHCSHQGKLSAMARTCVPGPVRSPEGESPACSHREV